MSVTEAFVLPTSYAQQRLWFLDQLNPGGYAFNIPIALRLEGALDVAALGDSLNEIVRRHESLRTTFASEDGEPVQMVMPELEVKLAIEDLTGLPESEREEQVQQRAVAEAQRTFDLARGPLLRATLLRVGVEERVLLLTFHHIVSDGWSMGVLIRELSTLYEAFTQGLPSPLADLPIQYADFAVWQREWLEGEHVRTQLDYWKQRLGGKLPVLELPTARPRPATQSERGAKHFLSFSPRLTAELKSLSQREGVTLFMTLLAAYQTLLARYTEQSDICVGSSIAGRNQPEIENLIGFFLNTLVLRTDLSGNPTFRELLGRVQDVALGAYTHGDVPVEMLMEALQPERQLSHNPLFQVMFIFQNAPVPVRALPGLTLRPVFIDSGTAKFDLTLDLEETEEGLRGWFEYSTDLFDRATIARMAGHLTRLLEGIVANPSRRIHDLPLLTGEEQEQLLTRWSGTGKNYARNVTLVELFAERAAKCIGKVAAVGEGVPALTYRALNQQSNQLARLLKELAR